MCYCLWWDSHRLESYIRWRQRWIYPPNSHNHALARSRVRRTPATHTTCKVWYLEWEALLRARNLLSSRRHIAASCRWRYLTQEANSPVSSHDARFACCEGMRARLTDWIVSASHLSLTGLTFSTSTQRALHPGNMAEASLHGRLSRRLRTT